MSGNYSPGTTLYFEFNTCDQDGARITLAGSPAAAVRKNGAINEAIAGVTLTVDLDGATGHHLVTVNTSADSNYYFTGEHFSVFLSAGTVDGRNIAGTWIGSFDLTKQVTNVTHVRGTQINTLISGRMDSYVGGIADGVLTAAKFAAGAFDAVWSVASRVLTAGTNIVLAKGTGVTGLNDLDAAAIRNALGLANANLDTQLGDIPTVSEMNARTLLSADYSTFDAATNSVNVDAVGGIAVTSPDDLKADVSGLLTVAGFVAPDNAGIGAIKAKTDNLPASPASEDNVTAVGNAVAALNNLSEAQVNAQVDLALEDYDGPTHTEMVARTLASADYATVTAVTTLDGLADAIKAKTDNLPADPASQAAVETAIGEIEAGSGASAEAIWTYSTRGLTDKEGFELVVTPPTAAEIVAALDSDSTQLAALLQAAGTDIPGLINALNDLSSSDVQSAAAAALTAYDPPTNAELEARTLVAADYATSSELDTVETAVDVIKVVTDKLDDTLELDSTVYRFTANALEEAPTGGAGGNAPTVEEIRAEIDANSTQLAAIKAKTDNLPPDFADPLADTYQADITLADDNAGNFDRYVVCWFRNGEPIDPADIASPTLQVVQASDGTTLVAETSVTQIGALPAYKHDQSTFRIVNGATYIAKATAIIDEVERVWVKPLSRDSWSE